MKMEKICRVVSKKEVAIQSGERKGEVVYRLAVSDGEGTLTDIQAKIEPSVFDTLVLFTKEYQVIFDYSLRSFNGKSYANFAIIYVLPSETKTKAN